MDVIFQTHRLLDFVVEKLSRLSLFFLHWHFMGKAGRVAIGLFSKDSV
jgi:hypothetical protein